MRHVSFQTIRLRGGEIQLAMGWQCGKNVFNCFLKLLLLTAIGSSWLTVIGLSWRKRTRRLFQIVGAAKLNERFAVRFLGTSRSDLHDDLRLCCIILRYVALIYVTLR